MKCDHDEISVDDSRWVVRRKHQPERAHQNACAAKRKKRSSARRIPQRRSQSATETAERTFANKQRREINEIAANYTWSPWRAPPKHTNATNDEDRAEPTAELQRWKLRDKCLRVASYYRITHLHARASETRRWDKIKTRFQRWAASWLEHVRAEAAGVAERAQWQSNENRERSRRGVLPSANTRMECKRPDVYRSGVRRYKPRTHQNIINRRLISKKGRKINIVTGAEIGPRLYENLIIIAKRCERERQRGDG